MVHSIVLLIYTYSGGKGPGNAAANAPWWAYRAGIGFGVILLIWIAYVGYKQYKKKQNRK